MTSPAIVMLNRAACREPGGCGTRRRHRRVDIRIGSDLGDWLVERGLRPAGMVTAMVRGEAPVAAGPARLYALIKQALG